MSSTTDETNNQQQPTATTERRRRLLNPTSKNSDCTASHYSTIVLHLGVPVSICILVVVWSVVNLTPLLAGKDQASPVPMVVNERNQEGSTAKAESGLVNALVVVGVIAAMTFLLVFLYKMRCMKILVAWLLLSVLAILGFQTWMWLDLFCVFYQIPYEAVSMTFFLWNFSVVGTIAVFSHGHPHLRQAYLVVVSVILAWILNLMPEWTTWSLLAVVAIYDILAVLCPKGPLNLLIKEVEKQQEPIPGLVYESQTGTAIVRNRPQASTNTTTTNSNNNNTNSNNLSEVSLLTARHEEPSYGTEELGGPPTSQQQRQEEEGDEEEYVFESQSFMLGLGDFVFYSVLVGRAAQYTYFTWAICFLAVLSGFCTTLGALSQIRQALPALPFSILFGIVFYLLGRFVLFPYAVELAVEGVY
eukprot:PhF_6_TR20825/c0_g1_i1/m.29977/K04505/PSEN1, PS1; presenilin 1